jgi:predicted short-subunit dehydrogenase-like oxidoreductase (DUF2520 family)
MGLALGAALVPTGWLERLTYFGRAMGPPPHPLFEPAPLRAGYARGPRSIPEDTTMLILAVPDGALSEVANDMARAGSAPPGCVALHLAGALSTDVLTPLHAVGYAVGSLHPLQTVADPWSGGQRLVGSAFAVAGEPTAAASARRLVEHLQGLPLMVPPGARPSYHASAVVASNYLVTLLELAVRIMGSAGIASDDAIVALLPLMRGTLDNVEHLGPRLALTGPLARGDVDTIRLHLARLSDEDRALYCQLGLETLNIARAAGLDPGLADELASLLSTR